MAEQFLNRLNKIEESINQLGETLKRMITILGTVTEIKSEVRTSKEEILEALKKTASAPAAAPSEDNTELAKMVVQEVGAVRVFVQESMETLKKELSAMLSEIEIPAPAAPVAPAAAPAATPAPAAAEEIAGAPPSLGADRGMKVADQLERIVDSMKMGCVAGDVLDVMGEVKAEIMKIVPSDPIMVKIDKWAGVVAGYPKRNELQARDILKLKKDLRDEIPKYRPA